VTRRPAGRTPTGHTVGIPTSHHEGRILNIWSEMPIPPREPARAVLV